MILFQSCHIVHKAVFHISSSSHGLPIFLFKNLNIQCHRNFRIPLICPTAAEDIVFFRKIAFFQKASQSIDQIFQRIFRFSFFPIQMCDGKKLCLRNRTVSINQKILQQVPQLTGAALILEILFTVHIDGKFPKHFNMQLHSIPPSIL